MKIFEPQPLHLVRLTISKIKEETFYINLSETTQEEAMNKVKSIIDGKGLSVFLTGNRTRIDFRDCIGGKNGKSKALSFRGLSTKETYSLILNAIK